MIVNGTSNSWSPISKCFYRKLDNMKGEAKIVRSWFRVRLDVQVLRPGERFLMLQVKADALFIDRFGRRLGDRPEELHVVILGVLDGADVAGLVLILLRQRVCVEAFPRRPLDDEADDFPALNSRGAPTLFASENGS